RRSTFTIRSTTGMRKKRPGPFGSGSSRPRRKTMARSYSRATLSAPIRNSTTTRRTTASAIQTAVTARSYSDEMNLKREPVELVDLDALPGPKRFGRTRLPELAVNLHEAPLLDDALHADDVLRADEDRPTTHGDRLRDRPGPETADHD